MKIHIIKIWPNISCTADPFAVKLGLMAHHHYLDYLVKRLNCSVVVRITGKVQNSSECSSRRYRLNC